MVIGSTDWKRRLDRMFTHKNHRKLELFVVLVLVIILIVAVKYTPTFMEAQQPQPGQKLQAAETPATPIAPGINETNGTGMLAQIPTYTVI